ncbi:hypothetical protein U1Q18_005464 [Sarracenia purpurea var. burkii]
MDFPGVAHAANYQITDKNSTDLQPPTPELESGGLTDKETGMSRSRGTINGADQGSGETTGRSAGAYPDPYPTIGRNQVPQSGHGNRPRSRPLGTEALEM